MTEKINSFQRELKENIDEFSKTSQQFGDFVVYQFASAKKPAIYSFRDSGETGLWRWVKDALINEYKETKDYERVKNLMKFAQTAANEIKKYAEQAKIGFNTDTKRIKEQMNDYCQSLNSKVKKMYEEN